MLIMPVAVGGLVGSTARGDLSHYAQVRGSNPLASNFFSLKTQLRKEVYLPTSTTQSLVVA